MSQQDLFREGAHCLLRVMNQQFWVRVTEAGEDAIRVSFPGYDYPIAGMPVELEMHEETGYRVFATQMTGRSANPEEGIILARPTELQQRVHRSSIRVESNLPVMVKDQVTVRKHAGTLINISQGGALFTTDGPFDFDSTLELSLELPGEPTHTLLGQVRHLDAERGSSERSVGVRFISPDAAASSAIERYIVQQLRAQYPSM